MAAALRETVCERHFVNYFLHLPSISALRSLIRSFCYSCISCHNIPLEKDNPMTLTGNARRMHPGGRISGFSLIEMMIVVAIMSILVMVGLPLYDRQILRTNRSSAQQYMMILASKQQQYMLDARAFAALATAKYDTAEPAPPLNVGKAGTNRYTFGIEVDVAGCAPSPCFIITATPTHSSQIPDGALTLNNLGVKTGNWTSN